MAIISKHQLKREHRDLVAAAAAHNFDAAAQKVWAATDLDTKKRLVNELMLEHFKYKDKVDAFKLKLQGLQKLQQVDKMAADIVLYQSGNMVLR